MLIVLGSLLMVFRMNIPVAAQIEPNSLPMAERDILRLAPRQYLHLIHPEYAKELDRIIQCESGWNPSAQNRLSSAGGLCQFLDSTWLWTAQRMGIDLVVGLKDKTEPYTHLEMCVWLYEQDGVRHWLESQGCHQVWR